MKRGDNLLRPDHLLEWLLYSSRWLLAPMYVGLAVALAVYAVRFLAELTSLVQHTFSMEAEELMLSVLNLVDISMVANLILMILIGGYTIFVQRMTFRDDEERPGWLHGISSGTLKVKMGLSLLGVTAVHLLKDFVEADRQSWDLLGKRMAVHGLFMGTCLAMVVTYRLLSHHSHGKSHGEAKHANTDRPRPAGGAVTDKDVGDGLVLAGRPGSDHQDEAHAGE